MPVQAFLQALVDRWQYTLLAIVLVFAAHAFVNPEISDWDVDTKRDYHQVIQMLDGKDFPVNSPVIMQYVDAGHVPGGFFYYLNALPYAVSRHPASGIVFLNLLNLLALLLLFFLARRMYDTRTGLLAALFFALSPWVLGFGRKFFHHNFGIFFVLLFLYLLWLWIHDRREFMVVFILPVLALLLQIHVIFLPVAGFFFLVLVTLKRPVRFGWLALGAVAAVATYAPFIVAEIQAGFPVLKGFLAFGKYHASGGGQPLDFLKALYTPFVMGSGEVSFFTRHQTLWLFGAPNPSALVVIAGVLSAILFQVVAYAALVRDLFSGTRRAGWAALRADREGLAGFLVVALIACFIVFHLARGVFPNPRYFAPLLPVLALLLALFFTRVAPRLKSRAFAAVRRFPAVFVALIAAANFLVIDRFLIAQRDGVVFTGDTKTPLKNYLRAAEYVLAASGGKYTIVNEKTDQFSAHLSPYGSFSVFLADWRQVPPAAPAPGVTRFHVHFGYGDAPPHGLFREAKEFRVFGNLTVFKLD